MLQSESSSQEWQRNLALLLKIRWVVFLFSLFFIIIQTFFYPPLSYSWHWLFGVFFILNLFYTLLFFRKAFLPLLLPLFLFADFLIIATADFLIGNLNNNLTTFFYLLLIAGSAFLASLKLSFAFSLLAFLLSLSFFLIQLFNSSFFAFAQPLPSPKSSFVLFGALLERGLLFFGLFFLMCCWLPSSKETEKKMMLERKREISSTLEALGDGILLLDKEGKVLFTSPQVEKLTGARASQLLEKIIFVDPKAFSHTIEFLTGEPIDWIKKVKKERKTQKYELKVLLPMEEKYIQVTLAPTFQSDEISGFIAILENVTERRRLEEMKSDFVSTVSHELRTPLTAIKGYASLLNNPKANVNEKKREEFLTAIERQADRLTMLINNLLNVSQLETRRLKLNKQPVKLKNLIEKVIVNLLPLSKNRKILVNFSPDFPLIYADPDRIEQVFSNLISNALKYSPADKPVNIEGKIEEDKVVILVEDKGIGIASSEIPYIFEKFHRIDRRLTRDVEGTGLGLYIAKNLVEIHGGEIWCESEVNKGSKFYVTLPYYQDNLET